MPATKILWGQILAVFVIVLATTWAATQGTAWQLDASKNLSPEGEVSDSLVRRIGIGVV